MFMKNQDARNLPREVQQHNRNLAIRLFNEGQTRKEISEIVSVHYGVVCRWIRRWQEGGDQAIELKKRGRKDGDNRKLTPSQENVLRTLLVEKNPQQMKLPFALWSRKAIQAVIYQMWIKRIAIRTIGDYMKRWGFTPQKPIKRAYEKNPEVVKVWLEETYPKIKKRAKLEGATIFWGDETGVRNDCQHSRGYAPIGQTPVVDINAKRFSLNMISAITNQGLVRFMIYKENMTAKVLIRFLKRLVKESENKIFLVLDNLRVHHAKIVKAWLVKNEESIELFYLPAYSPELNPDEYLNCDLKSGIRTSSPARNQNDLKRKVLSHMRMLQKKAARVSKYFNHRHIQYAM